MGGKQKKYVTNYSEYPVQELFHNYGNFGWIQVCKMHVGRFLPGDSTSDTHYEETMHSKAAKPAVGGSICTYSQHF